MKKSAGFVSFVYFYILRQFQELLFLFKLLPINIIAAMDMSKEELAENLLEVLRVNKTLSDKLTQSEKDRDDAVSQSMQFSEIMKKALNEITSLNELVSLMKQKCEISDSVISEFKDKLDHLMNNGTQQNGSGSEERVHELTEQLLEKTKELETSNAINIKLLKDNQSIRQDVEGMLQVLNGLEKQLDLYSGREEEVEEMVRQGNDKWNQAIAIQNEVRFLLLLLKSLK